MPKPLDEDQLRRKKELEKKRAARRAAKEAQQQQEESVSIHQNNAIQQGPCFLLQLPDDALQKIIFFLAAAEWGTFASTCTRLDRLLEVTLLPYLEGRLQDFTHDDEILIQRAYEGDTAQLVVPKATIPRELIGYARFVEQATCGYARLHTEEEILRPPFVQGRFVSVSPEHSVCRLNTLNGVATCGIGNRGQLGHNERVDVRWPQQIVGLGPTIVQVAAGGGLVRIAHTLLLTNTGQVWSCGTGQYGALGHGFSAAKQLPDVLRPTPIRALSRLRVVSISAGELHSACVTSDGDVYTWGDGFCGQLGHGDKRPQLVPRQVDGVSDEIVSQVSCGARHTLAVTEDGEVFSWGLGHYGALGRSYTPFEYDADAEEEQLDPEGEEAGEIPALIPQPANRMNPELAAHLDLIANLTLDDSSDQCYPKILDSLENIPIIGASAGHRHSLLLSKTGRLYSCGTGTAGCLGHGDTLRQKFPMLIASFLDDDVRIRQMSAGVDMSMAVATNGDVYAWGMSKSGRIGLCGTHVTIPRLVEMNGVPAVDVECGYVHSLIVGLNGTLHMCGGVGIDGHADGETEENGPQPVPNVNLWHRLAAPRKAPVVQKRWKKMGKYEVQGRSKMLGETDD